MYKYLIVAKDHSQFEYFVKNNGLRPSAVRYAGRVENLRGISNKIIVFLNGWRTRKDAENLWPLIQRAKHFNIAILEMHDTDMLATKKLE